MKAEYVDHMGSDLSVVDAARVSFAKKSAWVEEEGEERSLADADKRLIKYLATHKHWCYDDKTEVFTEQGWRLFKDIGNLRVAQVTQDDWTMEFVSPIAYHEDEYSGPMYLVDTNTVSYCVTPNHTMLYQNRNKIGYTSWVREEAEACFGKFKHFRTTAKLKQDGYGTYDSGLYLGFLLGDGFRVNLSTVSVRLKRPRKITFFISLLERLGCDYRLKVSDSGVYTFSVKDSATNLAKANAKSLPDLSDKSSAYLKGIFYGLMESDGSVKHNGWVYSSSSKELFEGVKALATACGFSLDASKVRHLDNPNHSVNYLVTVLSRHHANYDIRNGAEKVIQYDGKVFCVTVPSGLLLVRRNDKQLVCGNSPFAHPKLQIRLTLPIFVARQWEKHRVGVVRGYDIYDQSEVSRRYVKDEPQFFIPDVWRAAPDGSIKQGSGGALNDVANAACAFDLKNVIHTCLGAYNNLLRRGVAPEMARMVLPQNMMTQWIETGSLYYWFNLCSLRLDAHAQKEIRDLASQVAVIAAEHFTYSWQALTSARKNDHD